MTRVRYGVLLLPARVQLIRSTISIATLSVRDGEMPVTFNKQAFNAAKTYRLTGHRRVLKVAHRVPQRARTDKVRMAFNLTWRPCTFMIYKRGSNLWAI